MTVIFEIIEFLASFVEVVIPYLIFASILKDQRKHGNLYTDILLSILGVIIVRICNQWALFSYLTLGITAIYFSISARLLYHTNIITTFSISSFYLLCMHCFDLFLLTFISGFYQGSETLFQIMSRMGVGRAIVISIVNTLWALTYVLSRKYLKRLTVSVKGVYLIALTSICGFMGTVFLLSQSLKAFERSITLAWFMALCMLVLILVVIYFAVMRKAEKMEAGFLEMRNQLLNEKYHSLNEVYVNHSKLFHDLDNHLNVLYQLLENENLNDAKAYIQSVGKPVLELSGTEWTGVDVADVVINSKLRKMESLTITADFNIDFPQNANILPNDLCTLLSNLLDNAIEAVSKLENDRRICLTIRSVHSFLFLRVMNPCKTMERFEAFPATTKENTILHGWGLQNVRDVVDKYDGTIECTNKDGTFIVNIMLMIR
ncbi:MAG: GHKL domain-containing protein [Lachnospiraceae bacterium]|nr:GHKL domain-containing protein [Lachnospiraceae bacterium]